MIKIEVPDDVCAVRHSQNFCLSLIRNLTGISSMIFSHEFQNMMDLSWIIFYFGIIIIKGKPELMKTLFKYSELIPAETNYSLTFLGRCLLIV